MNVNVWTSSVENTSADVVPAIGVGPVTTNHGPRLDEQMSAIELNTVLANVTYFHWWDHTTILPVSVTTMTPKKMRC